MNAATAKRTVVEINGKSYGMDFDMMTLANAEQMYEKQFGKAYNAQQIISELIQQRVTAVMTVAYAAMRSAGEKLAWETFAKPIFGAMPLEWWMDTVTDGVISMLPHNDDTAAEDDEKN